MTNHGDDCYFFYYSTCSKGDSCPFRHCEAAMGIETVCNLWQEGRCFRTVCKFRHMEIIKNRKEIACYWEHQPAGCQKPHCAFSHDKGRYINGVYLPPNKCQVKNPDIMQEEPAPPPAAPLPTANPQLRGVKKAETLETVPSPTHPPVVVTCRANEDEDEDDQISEEGEEGKVGQDGSRLISPRKLPGGNHSDPSLNFGVSTLKEIRMRKNLKANLKKVAHPVQTSDAFANGVNTQSSFQPVLYEASNAPVVFEESGRPRGSMAERLGRKIHTGDDSTLLRKSLAGRLGNIVEEGVPPSAPQKALKSVKERLCLPNEPDALMPNAPSAENNMASNRAPEQIRIKTLEEIRKEKAAKLQSLSDSASDISTADAVSTKATRGTRRDVTVGDAPVGIKTLSELLHTKKRRQEEKQEQVSDPKKPKSSVEKVPGKTAGEPGMCDDTATAGAEVRVKTLEEIRREKAAKTQTEQAQQAHEVENRKNAAEESSAKRPRLLRVNREASNGSVTTEACTETTEKPSKPQPSAAQTNVKVKTFEEIMREKRLRKQEMEEQQSSSPSHPAESEPAQKPNPGATLKRKTIAKPSSTPPTTNPPCSAAPAQKAPIRKLMTLKPKAASPVGGTVTAAIDSTAVTAVNAVSVKPNSPPSQMEPGQSSLSPDSPREPPKTHTRSSPASSPTKQSKAAPTSTSAKSAPAGKTQNNSQKKSEQYADAKVRPKLNVKPSVMKPAVKVKPGQKGKAADRSAVAAVKPLNSATKLLLQETVCKEPEVFQSSTAQLSPAAPHSPSTPECTPHPQSPVVKTPTKSLSRKPSLSSPRVPSVSSTAASTAAVDDFDDLINEFSGDHLGEDMDPSIGEDDLLQELSDMIGS